MKGWQGKVLRIDLDKGTTASEELPMEVAKEYIGGYGLASSYLTKEVDPGIDALGPQNKLVIAAGPLVGTSAPSSSRYQVASKSPLTGTIACQNAGGHFGAAIKQAGYDAIIIEGRAKSPVYISINDNEIKIRPADDLWGKSVSDAERSIARQTEGAQVIAIGQAGESLAAIASISDGGLWSAGGAGLGAVMGSKNVKAVAIKGTQPVAVADPAGFKTAADRMMARIQSERLTSMRLPAYGTGALVHSINDRGLLPTQNFKQGTFAAASKISGEAVADNLLVRRFACFSCPVGCGRSIKGGGRAPELEHLWALGSNCGIDDLSAIAKAANLCYEYGLNPVETGAAIATAAELAEKGAILPEGRMKFGDAAMMVELVQEMGQMQDFGKVLAKCSRSLAEAYDHPDASVSIREQAIAAYDPRGNDALALHYATSLGNDDHLALGLRLWAQADVSALKTAQDVTRASSSAGMCPLASFAASAEEVASLISAATGVRYDADALQLAGARIWSQERDFAKKAGVDLAGKLPARLETSPVANLLETYYEARGWK